LTGDGGKRLVEGGRETPYAEEGENRDVQPRHRVGKKEYRPCSQKKEKTSYYPRVPGAEGGRTSCDLSASSPENQYSTGLPKGQIRTTTKLRAPGGGEARWSKKVVILVTSEPWEYGRQRTRTRGSEVHPKKTDRINRSMRTSRRGRGVHGASAVRRPKPDLPIVGWGRGLSWKHHPYLESGTARVERNNCCGRVHVGKGGGGVTRLHLSSPELVLFVSRNRGGGDRTVTRGEPRSRTGRQTPTHSKREAVGQGFWIGGRGRRPAEARPF